MVSCCVPLCENEKGKVKNVSFHEFPCDTNLREKWLKAISRQGESGGHWQPFDHSVVCSEHFTAESYREDCKRRVLKIGSIPSIFCNHPSHLKDPVKAKDNIATHCNDGQMVNKIETKEENLTPFTDLKNEADIFTSYDVMNNQNSSIKHTDDCEMDTKIEIKKEAIFSHINLDNNADFFSDKVIKIKNNSCVETEDCEMDSKIEIKEELPSMERILTKPEYESVSALQMQNKKKDGINEDFQLTKTPRLCRDEEIDGNYILEGNVCLLKSERDQECKQHENILCDSNLPCKESYLNNEGKTYIHEIHEKNFTANSALKKHSLIHKKTLKCSVCEKVFIREGHLNSHAVIHEGKKSSNSDICEEEHLETNNLIPENKKLYKCNTCCKRFTRMSSLKRHNLVHEGKRPYKCEICEKSFADKSTLSKHNLIHEGRKQHQCNFCGKQFTHSSSLYRHVLIHEGKKPHKCNICEKSFNQKSGLNRHTMSHEGKKRESVISVKKGLISI